VSLLESKHWRFSDDGREFIITRRDLPDPWENRICTDDFNAIIRQDGSGFCGVRAGYDGLEIDPRMPTSWRRAKVRRPWRGAVYDIEILNPHGVPVGPVTMELDGRVLDGDVIPPPAATGEHRVRVTVGA